MSIELSTITVTTDPFSGIGLDSVSYTTVSVSWQNASSSSAEFRIVGDEGSSIESSNIQVSGGATGSHTVSSLDLNTTVKLYLERYEVDSWVRQTSSNTGLDYVEATTLDSSVSINVGSSSASISWTNPGIDPSITTYSVQYISAGANDSATQNGSVVDHSSLLTNLTQGQEYMVMVSVIEGETTKRIGNIINFTTSSGAAMEISEGPFASYIALDWSASSDGGDFRIVNRDTNGGGDSVLVESATITSAIIADLEPGSTYVFVLQRLELGGDFSDQSQSMVSTPTSTISVGSVGSQTLEVSWGNLYDGAIFEVFFNGESAGTTTETTMTLRDLAADTSYTIALNVLELGESLGLSSLGLSTNQSLSQKFKLPITIPAVTLILLIILFLMKKQ